MAYSTSNPPRLTSIAPLTGAGQVWQYTSSDPAATVDGNAYISNGEALGMKVGDLVIVNDTITVLTTMHRVHTVNASSGVDLGTGISIGSSANAD